MLRPARGFSFAAAFASRQDYRLARMVTTASTPEPLATFRHDRFSLFDTLETNATIIKIPPLQPPPPTPGAQGEPF
jgi:hypothetical protein